MIRTKVFTCGLVSTIISIARIFLKSRIFPEINSLKIDRSCCYIFGNGPSLKNDISSRLDFFSQQELFVVNHFAKDELYVKLEPKFYVFADEAFWITNENLEVQKKINETLESIKNRTSWNLYILVPWQAKQKIKFFFINNKNIKIIAYNRTPISGFRFFKYWAYRRNLGMPHAQTVLNATIVNAINMGYVEINVMGCDHSWHRNLYLREDNVLCFVDDHFYDQITPESKPLVEYLNTDISPKVHEQLYASAKALETHHLINEYAEHIHVKIFNRSSVTFVDAYERKSL